MVFQVFLVGFLFSFVGSIPPGTLNLLVLQLGMEKKFRAAWQFTLAVTLVEYPYAWIAVVFEDVIMSSAAVLENFQLIAAVVMTTMGVASVISVRNPGMMNKSLQGNGFVRGLILSILNPQAIPFWIATTAYLKSAGWIVLDSAVHLHSYLLGTAVGVFVLLLLLIYGSRKLSYELTNNRIIRLLPGVLLLVLGLVAWAKYFGILN